MIEVPVVETIHIKGNKFINDATEQAKEYYADNFNVDTSIYNILLNNSVFKKYALLKDEIKITALAEPDFNKIYQVCIKDKWNKNQKVNFAYNSDGILTEGESSYEDKTFEIIIESLNLINKVINVVVRNYESNIDSINSLKEIQNKYENLAKISDFEIYKAEKNRLDEKYSKLYSKYFYSTLINKSVKKIYYTPENEDLDKITHIFDFDEKTGVIFVNDLPKLTSRSRNVQKQKLTTDFNKNHTISLTSNNKDQLADKIKYVNDVKNNGFAYNIPKIVQLKFYTDKDTIINELFKIAQLGKIGYIKSGNNKLSYNLDPLTGELKKLTVENESALNDQINSVSAISSDLIKLVMGEDPDTKLEKEVKRLENEIKKRNLEKQLENNF